MGTRWLWCVVTDQIKFIYKRLLRRWLDRLLFVYVAEGFPHCCLGWRIHSGEPDCLLYVPVATWRQQQQWLGLGYLSHGWHSTVCFLPSWPHHSANVQHISSSSDTNSPRSQLYTWRPSSDLHCKPPARSSSTSGSRELVAIDHDDVFREMCQVLRRNCIVVSSFVCVVPNYMSLKVTPARACNSETLLSNKGRGHTRREWLLREISLRSFDRHIARRLHYIPVVGTR